ncbi:MAG: EboA domain-containing protein [Aquabacterium sp.]
MSTADTDVAPPNTAAPVRLRPYVPQIAHELTDHLFQALAGQPGGDAARAWLEEATTVATAAGQAAAQPPADGAVRPLLVHLAGAARHLRRVPAPPSPTLMRSLRRRGVHKPEAWALLDRARVLLMLAAVSRWPMSAQEGVLRQIFLKGDSDERRAVLQSLVLMPEPSRFVALAIEGCRSSVGAVFEAVAADNAYAACWFPPPAFNQMVLKALSTGLPTARIVGLQDRLTPALAQMVQAHVSERRAAGRAVSDDALALLERHQAAPRFTSHSSGDIAP